MPIRQLAACDRDKQPRFLQLSLALMGCWFVSGCQTARMVYQTPDMGIVAIPSNTSKWPHYHRRKAEELMRQQFPEGYLVESEGEEVVGYDTHQNGSAHVQVAGPLSISMGDATTTQRTEWRIKYRRMD